MATAPANVTPLTRPSALGEQRKLVTFERIDQIAQTRLQPVIDGILFEDTLGSVVGRSGCCKSFLVQGMCAAVATGTPWMGRAVQQGAVFYLGGEGRSGIRKRFDGWSAFTGVPLTNAPLFIASGLPSLADDGNVTAVIAEIGEVAEALFFAAGCYEPKLVVIDTFARAMAGRDENSAADVGRLIAGLDWIRERWGCCVLVIHHTGHGENTRERGRGSSAYYAALDSELLVTSDGARVTVKSTKEKDWPKPEELILDRNVVEVSVEDGSETTLVLTESDADTPQVRAMELRREIQRLKADGRSIRAIAAELGITKAKVEHELSVIQRHADEYRRAAEGD